MGAPMTKTRLAALGTVAATLGLLVFGAYPGRAARPDALRPLLDHLQSFDTAYLRAYENEQDYWVYAAADGRVTVDIMPGDVRYYFDGQQVYEDSAFNRWYGRRDLVMPEPDTLEPPLTYLLDQARRRFADFRVAEEAPPQRQADSDTKFFHFVPFVGNSPEVYVTLPARTGIPTSLSLFHEAFLSRYKGASREFYLMIEDLAFDVPIPVGTFQANRPGPPCEVPSIAMRGQCVPPHHPLFAEECDSRGTNDASKLKCEFIHPPSHPASEFEAGGDCHRDEHADRNDHRECGDDHDDDNDDPGEEDHDHDDHGGGDHEGGNDHGGGDHGGNDHGGSNQGGSSGGSGGGGNQGGNGHGDDGRGGKPRGR